MSDAAHDSSLWSRGQQERGRRAGTEKTPAIVGLGVASELAQKFMEHEGTRVRALRDRLEKGILQRVEHALPMGDPCDRLPNTATIAFEFIEGEAILLHLNRAGIAASSGSARSSGSLEPSLVLRAMDVPFTAAHGAIRFSLSRETIDGDVDAVLDTLPSIIAKLRALSPFWEAGQAVPKVFNPAYA